MGKENILSFPFRCSRASQQCHPGPNLPQIAPVPLLPGSSKPRVVWVDPEERMSFSLKALVGSSLYPMGVKTQSVWFFLYFQSPWGQARD